MVPVSWSELPSQPPFRLTGEELPGIDDLENQVVVEEDEDLEDLPRPPDPPDPPSPPGPPGPYPPLPEDRTKSSGGIFSGLLGTFSEAWKITSDIRAEVDEISKLKTNSIIQKY